MALTKSLQPISVLPALSGRARRPTELEWQLLREFITDSYKRHTVRWILQELTKQGFSATDKILRGRLKRWHIDTKNQRKKTGSMRRPPIESQLRDCPKSRHDAFVVINEDLSTSSELHNDMNIQSPSGTVASRLTLDNTSDRSSTLSPQSTFVAPLSNLRIEYIGQYSIVGIVDDNDECDTYVQPVGSFETSIIPQPLNTRGELQRQQAIREVANWYDRLTYLGVDSRVKHLSERSPHIFFDKLSDGLAMVLTNQVVARKLLQDAGPRGSIILQQFDPTLAPILIRYIITWRHYGKFNQVYMGYVNVILRYLIRLSHDNLGAAHPITILIANLISDLVPAELCNMLCNAIAANYVSRPENNQHCRIRLRILFGEILVSQGRFEDVDGWYNDTIARSEGSLSEVDLANALRVLAESRRRRGLHQEAEDAVMRALGCVSGQGFRRNRAKCVILKQYARFKLSLGLLDSSEELFQEAMTTALELNFKDLELCIACDLWSLYEERGKRQLADRLITSYPNILEPES